MRFDVALVKLKNAVKSSPTVSRVAILKDDSTVEENAAGR
jgi:hypothetical protein